MLKKGYFLGLIVLFTVFLIPMVHAEETPWWVNQIEVWETNGVVYSVAKAPYNPTYDDAAYIISFKLVTTKNINKIKTFLGIANDKSLIGFQIIYVYYTTNSFYLLGAAPRTANTAKKVDSQLEPIQPEESSQAPLVASLNQTGVKGYDQVPKNWWKLYTSPATPTSNVFMVGNTLYAIGKGLPNPQLAGNWLTMAKRGATADSQRNLVAVLNGALIQTNGVGDYNIKIQGLLRGATESDFYKVDIRNPVFVLLQINLQP